MSELDFLDGMSDEELDQLQGELGRARANRGRGSNPPRNRNTPQRPGTPPRPGRPQQPGRPPQPGTGTPQPPKPESKGSTSRSKFMSRIGLITDPEVRQGLDEGRYSLTDMTVYATKKADGTRLEMFQTADAAEDGVTNITQAKLPSNSWFLVEKFIVQSGINAAVATDPKGKQVNYGLAAAAIVNGNYKFGNGTTVFVQESGADVFKHSGGQGVLVGEYTLENPKMINPKMDLVFDLETAGIPVADTYVRVALKGSMIVRA